MSSPTSSPPAVTPKRSQTGATGSSRTILPPPQRTQSFAFFSRKSKSKRKFKMESISSYRLETEDKRDELAEFLMRRFAVSRAELKLQLKRDFYTFYILEDDRITKEDTDRIEVMRPAEEEGDGGA